MQCSLAILDCTLSWICYWGGIAFSFLLQKHCVFFSQSVGSTYISVFYAVSKCHQHLTSFYGGAKTAFCCKIHSAMFMTTLRQAVECLYSTPQIHFRCPNVRRKKKWLAWFISCLLTLMKALFKRHCFAQTCTMSNVKEPLEYVFFLQVVWLYSDETIPAQDRATTPWVNAWAMIVTSSEASPIMYTSVKWIQNGGIFFCMFYGLYYKWHKLHCK